MSRNAFHEMLEDRARTFPNAVAVETEGGSVSFADLNRRAGQIAVALVEAGVTTGVVVGLFTEPGVDHVAGMLGVGRAGGAFLPLPPDLPERRLAGFLDTCDCGTILVTPEHAPVLRDRLAAIGRGARVIVLGPDTDGRSAPFPAAAIGPDDPCYVMFTSGSTGTPKAILGRHKGLSHFLKWEIGEFGLDASTRGSWLAPTTFDVSLRDVLVPLLAGGTVVVPEAETRVRPDRLVDWIAARRLTLVHCVPTVLRLVLRELRDRGETRPGFPALRHLLVAGEPLRGEDVAAWRELSGSNAEVVNLYGPSETTLAKLFHRVVGLPDDPRRVLPIGRPLPNTAALILSNGRLCDPGEIGEIHIRTPYRSLGYLGNPEATAVAFVADPLSPDKPEVIYKTGDLGRYTPDGLVECLGRRDDQVKINGVRIEPAEIEAALRGLPGVAEAAVAVHPRFDGERELVGYYVRADGSTDHLPVDALDRELARVLPDTMRPRHLMPLAELPTTLSGKINRKALPKPEALFLEGREIVDPVGPTETRLAAIWAEMFGLSRVGTDTGFRELGGDSLRAVRLVMRIHREFGVDVSLRTFFAGPTVREVARAIDAGAAPAVEIPRVADAPDYPVTPAQSRMWRLTRMGVAPTAHNLVDSYRLSGPLNEDALERAFRFLIDRHEPLRTVFRERDGEPRQVIRESVPWSIERIDLRAVPDAEGEAERLALADHDHLFDLETGPLLRVVLIRLPDDEGERRVMLFNIHHIIGDVWSFNVLARELETAYAALLRGVEPELPPLPIRFRDAVAWTAGRVDETARRYWLDKLAEEIPPLDFPTDRPRPPVRTFNGATERFRLPGADTVRLRSLTEARGATPFVALSALTKVLLHRHTGRRDIVVGFPVAGRDHSAMEPLIGCLVDTGVSRDRVAPETSFLDLLDAVGRGIEEARANPYPFDALVDELNLPRDMSRSPLFDVLVAAPTRTDVDPVLEGVVVTGFGRGNAWNFARYDLVFHFEEDGDELVLDLNFNTDLFDAARIRRCGEQFLELTRQVVAAPDTPIGRVAILPAAERATIERFSRGPLIERPAGTTIPGMIADVAARFPDRPALIDASRVLTFAEMNRAVDRLARRLVEKFGMEPGDRVAVLAERSIEGVVALSAITRAGGVYVPIDPEYPEARIARMLDRADCRLILVGREGRLPIGDRTVDLIRIDAETDVEPFDRARPDDPAYIIFTSGSTGEPKAVEVAHRGFVSMSLGQIETFGLTPEDRTLWFASPSFDASLADIFMGLFSGGAVVVPERSVIESIPAFLEFVRKTGTTCVTLPPTYLRALNHAEIPGLRILITAGEAAATAHSVERARTIRVFNAYGPTEASVCATIHRVDPTVDGARVRLPIGRPLANTTLRILDEALEPVPIGVTGEIFLGGVGLALGYRGDPETTAARFITHPRDGLRLYRTGDLGRFLADGSVDFLGRTDDQVKIAGHRIETGEVEAALASLPGVAAAHVATVTRGDGSKALAGWYAVERRIELWPSVAEFFVYDDVAYTSMATDEGRNARYRAAFARHLRGRSVIDIGTGPVAILSRLAVEAGADHVTAIDLLENTARKARETVERLGLSDRIEVINADAATVELPEPADVCVSEIVGAIGGSEGAAKIINAARRLLKDPSAMLPKRALTKMAVVNVPAASLDMGFSDIAAHYVERIFAEVGRPFDLRLCLKNLPRSAIVSDDAPFEDLDFTREVPLEATHDVVLTVNRDGPITGFLVWLTLHVDDDQVVDILEHPGSWLPVYLPVFLDGVPAGAGDRIVATVERKLCSNGLNPDFTVTGRLERRDGSKVPFRVDSPHFGGGFRVSPLHARIFADASVPRLEAPTPVTLRRRLSAILPSFAVPTHLIEVEAIPTTVNGKVDRSRLPSPVARTLVRRDPDTPVERSVLEIWREVLERADIGLDDDFFALGGDSIRAIQIVSRLRRVDLRAEIRDVFQNSTVARLAGVVVPLRPTVEREPVVGRAPTTPIQNWFLRTVTTTPNRFVQCAVLRATGGVDPQSARRAVRALWVHHDALRLRLVVEPGSEPEQEFVGTDGDPGFTTISSTGEAEFEAAVAAARDAFDLARGPLFTAVLAPGSREDRLALIAHHLVVDAVSWGVLIDDFESAYESAIAGEEPRLPPRTSSYRDHAVATRRLVDGRDWSASLDRWRGLDLPVPTRTRSPAVSTVSITLDRAETERVSAFGDRGGDGRADDATLAALFVAARRTSGKRRVAITVEGHGRDLGATFGGEPRLDLTRTVGWFTSFTPLSIDVPDDAGRVAATVREARRRLPDDGRSFMLLAHGGPNAPLPPSLGRIGFNHLGRLPAGRSGGRFAVDWEAPTPIDEAGGPAIHPISVLTSVVDGRLRIDVDRDPSLVTFAEAEALTRAFVDALREIVAGETADSREFGIGDLTAEALDELLDGE